MSDLRGALLGLVFGLLPQSLMAEPLLVFAAASLKGALDEVAQDFEGATGQDVVISYASSNALAKQIIAGAPAQIFISASEAWMEEVAKAGHIHEGAMRPLLGNRLVLVGAKDAPIIADLAALPAMLAPQDRIAMGLVEAVPAGQYGKAAFEAMGLWSQLQPHVVQGDNVRAALTFVARGEARFGVVYATDVAASPEVATLADFPDAVTPQIVLPVGLLTGSDPARIEGARAFYDWLGGAEAGARFAAQGFTVRSAP